MKSHLYTCMFAFAILLAGCQPAAKQTAPAKAAPAKSVAASKPTDSRQTTIRTYFSPDGKTEEASGSITHKKINGRCLPTIANFPQGFSRFPAWLETIRRESSFRFS